MSKNNTIHLVLNEDLELRSKLSGDGYPSVYFDEKSDLVRKLKLDDYDRIILVTRGPVREDSIFIHAHHDLARIANRVKLSIIDISKPTQFDRLIDTSAIGFHPHFDDPSAPTLLFIRDKCELNHIKSIDYSQIPSKQNIIISNIRYNFGSHWRSVCYDQVEDTYKIGHFNDGVSTDVIQFEQTSYVTEDAAQAVTATTYYNYFSLKIKYSTKIMTTKKTIGTKGNMMTSYLNKLKATMVPQIDENLKMSMTGQICVAYGEDEFITATSNGDLETYPSDLMSDLPVFTISKTIAEIKVGDIVQTGAAYARVMSITKGKISSVSLKSGNGRQVKSIKDFFTQTSTTRVVMDMLGNGSTNIMNNPMLLLMMKGTEGFNIKSLLKLQMMKQSNGDMNSIMMQSLMFDEDGSSSMKDMLMMQMMAQQSGGTNMFNNPMMLMMMSNDDDSMDLEEIMMMQMMSQNSKSQMDPMMSMMLMESFGGEGKKSPMMKYMLMNQLMTNNLQNQEIVSETDSTGDNK